jgi:hypothetical protein
MGGTITVVVIRVVEAVFRAKEQAKQDKKGRDSQEKGFNVHDI